MRFIRYVNGRKIEAGPKRYMIENDVILKTIQAVNDRLRQGVFPEEGS